MSTSSSSVGPFSQVHARGREQVYMHILYSPCCPESGVTTCGIQDGDKMLDDSFIAGEMSNHSLMANEMLCNENAYFCGFSSTGFLASHDEHQENFID